MDLAGPKELRDAKVFDKAPILSVGGVDEPCRGVGDLIGECKVGAEREGKVVGFEDVGGSRSRGDNKARGGSKAEVEDGAVFEGEIVEGLEE